MKTRLVPALGGRGAADLYRAFLADMLATAGSVPGVQVELWLEGSGGEAPGGGDGSPPLAAGTEVRIRRQRGEDLGARLVHAFGRSFREEAARALAVGTDHPTLPPDYLERAFAALDRAEAAWGPSADGGYWGLALRRDAWPRAEALFREIPWSTRRVLEETRARARDAGLGWRELPAWYDVDDPEDLERLRRDVRPGTRTARALARLRRAVDPGSRAGVEAGKEDGGRG